MAMIKDLATVNAELQEQKERVDTVDFKMVTFSLAGKDYGVDIMNVKEIAKADKFTYVPNAASFVRGVYNLRGDIIPIIDLRTFFHLPMDTKDDGLENMLILRIEDRVYGTIVDKIDKVVGINSETIQPPHPIFGDINIKFISGVVEKEGDLYIILDVIRIFTQTDEEKQKPRTPVMQEASPAAYFTPAETAAPPSPADSESALGFIRESLLALKHFAVSPLNDEWLARRFSEWAAARTEPDLQFKNEAEAAEFLAPFYSPCSEKFWDEDYAAAIKGVLPDLNSNNIQVWNLGCGKGYETFSFGCILKSRYPDGRIKIWANDNDIMAISQAPNMVFDLDEVPEYCRGFMSRGRNGYVFNQAIKDSLLFEYHDILNENSLPELDIILARDLLSFLSAADQERIIAGFTERLKSRNVVILGRNERLTGSDWKAVGKDPVSAFTR
ncbi:MAG: chemotaxis protein CheW [Spirochaetaceae bacterium]|jgi:purine-binding chemotaxis protein CheW|nr:chemotaxis protein CheW [Spirochaetaceae bacterium]